MSRCCCSKQDLATGAQFFTSRPPHAMRSTLAGSTGATRANPSLISAAGESGIHAGGCSADRRASTDWCSCAAIHSTTKDGPKRARPGGPTPTSCPTSGSSKPRWTDRTRIRATEARCRSPPPRGPIRSRMPSSRRAGRRDIRSAKTSTDTGRTAGSGWFPMNAAKGLRWSAARAYLYDARRRANLDVQCGSHVDRIEFEGRRAVAVAWRRGNRPRRIRVGREVVLSAGAFNSPKLLMLSGIGDGDALKMHGIPVVRDLPGSERI